MARKVALIVAVAAAGLTAVPAAAGGGGCHAYDEEITAGRGFKGPSVPMQDCAFTPTILYVEEGTEVQWVNMDPVPHTVTGAQLSWGSTDHIPTHDTSGKSSKGVVTHRFESAGVYPYYCVLHPGMAGAVVVGDVETSKEAADPVALAASRVEAAAPVEQQQAPAGPWPGWIVGAFAGGLAVALGVRRRVGARR